MSYQYEDLSISKCKLHNFLQNELEKGEYTTFDILEKYQGSVKRNQGINVCDSWNANFGHILSMCARERQDIIEKIQDSKKVIVDNEKTTTAVWKIL